MCLWVSADMLSFKNKVVTSRFTKKRKKEIPFKKCNVPSKKGPLSNHCADCVEVGVEADHFAFNRLGVGVVHGVLERGLAIVVLVDGAARVLGFISLPVEDTGNTELWATLTHSPLDKSPPFPIPN